MERLICFSFLLRPLRPKDLAYISGFNEPVMPEGQHRVEILVSQLLAIARQYPGHLHKNVRKQVESIVYELKWTFKYTDIEISKMSGSRWVEQLTALLETITKHFGGNPEDVFRNLGTYRDSMGLQEEIAKRLKNVEELTEIEAIIVENLSNLEADFRVFDRRMMVAVAIVQVYAKRKTNRAYGQKIADRHYVTQLLGASKQILSNHDLDAPLEIAKGSCPNCGQIQSVKVPFQELLSRLISLFQPDDDGYQSVAQPWPQGWPRDLYHDRDNNMYRYRTYPQFSTLQIKRH